MPKPKRQTRPVLPIDVRLRVADLAGILDGKDREEFCDVIQLPVQLCGRSRLGVSVMQGL